MARLSFAHVTVSKSAGSFGLAAGSSYLLNGTRLRSQQIDREQRTFEGLDDQLLRRATRRCLRQTPMNVFSATVSVHDSLAALLLSGSPLPNDTHTPLLKS